MSAAAIAAATSFLFRMKVPHFIRPRSEACCSSYGVSQFSDDRTTKLFSRQSLRPTIFHLFLKEATTTVKWPEGAFTGTTRAQDKASVEYWAIRSADEGP